MQHCLQLITPVLVPNHEHDAFLQPIKPSHLPKTALAASWIHLRAITYHHMERSETWVHHSTCILYFFHQHLMSWGVPASAITPVTAFGRLELELEWCERKILLGWLELEMVAGVVWEENTIGLELECLLPCCECFNYLVPLIWGNPSLCINGHPWQCAAAAGMEPPVRAGSWLASGPDALAFTERLILGRKFGKQTPIPSSQVMNRAMGELSSARWLNC